MPRRRRWSPGWNDLAATVFLLGTMALGTPLDTLGVPRAALLVLVGVGGGLVLRHLLPADLAELAVVPPALAVLAEVATTPLSVAAVAVAAAIGVALLVWVGAEPNAGVPLRQQFEPALIPALGAALALAVLFFLPKGTGGQEGLAGLAVAVALGLAAWVYLQSAAEAVAAEPTS